MPTRWVVLTTRPTPDGQLRSAYWLGPHAGDHDAGPWSPEVARFSDHDTAERTARDALDDAPGTWLTIPEAEALPLT